MKRDGPFRSPAPLTATEAGRRAAAMKANQESHQPTAAAVSSEMLEEVAAVDEAGSEVADEHLFGRRTAQFLSDCRRDVALAPQDAKKIVFQEIAKKIGQEVAGQWLPKTVMMDRLSDIAEAHGSFRPNPGQIQQLIGDSAGAIHTPQTAPAAAPPKPHLTTPR